MNRFTSSSATLLVPALGCWLACAATAATVTFDFDTGTPLLFAGHNLPLDQVSGGVAAHFSSPTVGAGGFSVQSDATTHFHLSQFSGNYLYPNSVYNPALDIQFDQPVTGITFTFATADFQQVEVPTTIQLTAYKDTTGTPSIGVATAHGTYAGDTMPMGTLSFSSAVPFNLVELVLPYQPQGATDFLVDNITVTTSTIPTATATASPTPTPPSPSVCVGDCTGNGQVTVNELVIMVNIALDQMPVSACSAGDANQDGMITVTEIIAAVNNALGRCVWVVRQTIFVPDSFVLDQPNVDVASITVAVQSTEQPFPLVLLQPMIDYMVNPLQNAVQISLITLPPPFVVPGTYTFVVTYSVVLL